MSRRFGRNQKRAMRAQVENLESKVLSAEKRTHCLHAQMRANEETIELVARILGPDFVGLEPRRQERSDEIEHWRARPFRDSFSTIGRMSSGEVERLVAYSVLEIEMNQSKLDFYRDQVQFSYKTPVGHVAYGMTREAWERMPRDAQEMIVRREIAFAMSAHLMRERRRT